MLHVGREWMYVSHITWGHGYFERPKVPNSADPKTFHGKFCVTPQLSIWKILVKLHHISQVTCAEATKNMYQHTSNQNVQIFHLGVTYLGYTRQFLSSRFNTEKTLVLPPKIHKYFGNRENVLKWKIKSKNIWRSCKIFGLSYTSDTHWSDEFLWLHWGNEVTRIATNT